MKEQMLVIGGTGKTGRKVVNRLREKGYSVRIGSRSASLPFDWQKPEGWSDVLRGIDKAYITFQPDLAVPWAANAIRQLATIARDMELKHLVLLSGAGEREAERCEQILLNSGVPTTILRAMWFNQNFSESFLMEPILAGNVMLPNPNAQVAFVDTDDIADMAVEALTTDQHEGKIYNLTGPSHLSFAESVGRIAEVTGRQIQVMPISHSQYEAGMEEAGVPADYRWLISYLFREVLPVHDKAPISNDIERILGRPAKDFAAYVAETAATGVWSVSN